jgi:hypothetical protein
MKRAVFSALFLGLLGAVAAVPASADSTIYSSGPGVNNTTNFDAWNISSPFIVTNSFTLFGNSNVTGTTFDVWLSPGDAISSVDWSFGNVAFNKSLGSGTATLTPVFDVLNGSGFDVYTASFSGLDVSLTGGTYYFTLQNAVVTNNDFAYWDENDGSSTGYTNSNGSIGTFDCQPVVDGGEGICGLSGGETFTLEGTSTATPEPSSFLLLGSGLAGLAGLLKRKIRA